LVLDNRNATSQEEALKRISSLPPVRQGKVLDIRRQIAKGTYEVADRLDKAMNRVLESLTA
jgi:anti-sigma28 factor (negative regulator of flagellin synthesis)